jgi:hypothetical protein
MNTATAYVIGNIWQPGIGLCAQSQVMRGEELDRMTFQGRIDRDDALSWAYTTFGDFQNIVDITVIRHGRQGEGDLEWQDGEESETIYNECMAPDEDGDED